MISFVREKGTDMDFEKITAYLDSLPGQGIPGADCIICRDHQVLYRHMVGTNDRNRIEPVHNSDRYLMFSMTKVQTMTAFMQLVEQGKISLQDEVAKYLPAYGRLMVKKDGIVEEAKESLKIWQLLSMQSGLNYDLERPGIRRVLNEKGMNATTRELVDSFVESPLDFEPGTHFQYSLSHDVAAAVIEVVSGMSFGEYLKKNIWEPLGMNRTSFARPMNDAVENLAQQYIMNEDEEIVQMEQSCCYQLSDAYESGGAGLISCTEDYAVLADMIACGGEGKNGARILKPETVERIKTNLLCEAGRKDIADSMGRAGYGYGCGMQVLMEPEKIGSTSPAGVFGWDGAAGSCITMETGTKTSIVYIMHVRNCGFAYGVIHPTLRDMVFGNDK